MGGAQEGSAPGHHRFHRIQVTLQDHGRIHVTLQDHGRIQVTLQDQGRIQVTLQDQGRILPLQTTKPHPQLDLVPVWLDPFPAWLDLVPAPARLSLLSM